MGIELVFPVHRRGERQRSQRAQAAEAAEHSHPARDPERIGPPRHHQHRDRQHDREPHLPGEPGDDNHQEGERGEVDDHDVDERRRHHEDIVLELRQRDQDDDQQQRQRCRRHRPPQQDQPEEIEQAPGENESRPCGQVDLGPDQQACGGQLHRGKDRDGTETPAIGGRKVLFQIDDGRRHDGCQGRALATSPARRLSSFCNKAVMARAWRPPPYLTPRSMLPAKTLVRGKRARNGGFQFRQSAPEPIIIAPPRPFSRSGRQRSLRGRCWPL